MREIGSEFWNVPTTEKENNVFPEYTQWFLSGRSALQAIIRELEGCQTVAMPSWCCDSMVKPFIDAGIDVHFYPVYWQNGLTWEICLDMDILFLMDYFGYTSPVPNLCSYKGIVIRDETHSLFSATYCDADYYFGSLRKWCGVWTGGYAWARDRHRLGIEADDIGYVSLREEAMRLKKSYLHGYVNKEGNRVNDKSYLKVFEEAENILDHVRIAPAADRDVYVAKRLDVELIRFRRRANAEVLRKAFPDWLIFQEMVSTDCPMFVPVLVPDGKRDELRKHLIQNDIYCPIHWPVSDYYKLNEQEQYIYDNEISFVCDQRYREDDMLRMVETIKTFMEE